MLCCYFYVLLILGSIKGVQNSPVDGIRNSADWHTQLGQCKAITVGSDYGSGRLGLFLLSSRDVIWLLLRIL